MSIENLPKTKWSTAGNQVILKTDFVDVEQAVLDSIGYISPPPLTWATVATIKVLANAGSPARLLLTGFPDVLHPGQFVNPTGSDGTWRENTVDETLDISSGTCRWGTEQASTWYAILAVAPTGSGFDLKAMPYMRVKADAANKITTRNNAHSADLNYGFADDDLIDSYIYVISGAKKGYSALITSNDATGGLTNIDYDGSSLSLAAGDWFIVLPALNFRWIGDVFNSSGSDLLQFIQEGAVFRWYVKQSITSTAGVKEDIKCASPLATMALIAEDPASPTDAAVYVSHPTYTIQRVLLYEGISHDQPLFDGGGHYTGMTDTTYISTYAPGPCPVPVELCKYNVTAASVLSSSGYGYAKIL